MGRREEFLAGLAALDGLGVSVYRHVAEDSIPPCFTVSAVAPGWWQASVSPVMQISFVYLVTMCSGSLRLCTISVYGYSEKVVVKVAYVVIEAHSTPQLRATGYCDIFLPSAPVQWDVSHRLPAQTPVQIACSRKCLFLWSHGSDEEANTPTFIAKRRIPRCSWTDLGAITRSLALTSLYGAPQSSP